MSGQNSANRLDRVLGPRRPVLRRAIAGIARDRISAGAKHSSSNVGDQVLALATGKTQQEIAAACKGARPNHVGAALSRHKRAGRIEERDGKLYAISQLLRDEVRAILAHRKGCRIDPDLILLLRPERRRRFPMGYWRSSCDR